MPSNVAARVAVEAGIADYWYKYVGLKGAIVGMTGYGNLLRRISCSRSLALPPEYCGKSA
ncbi:transketolase-like TK C-terminal-containing protein [Escherichia coli]